MSTVSSRPWRHLYNTAAWQRLRAAQLASNPICEYCEAQSYLTPATVVDHIIAHKGDEILFYSPDNLRSLCKKHHDATKQREEISNVQLGGSVSGIPLDPSHHWNAANDR